MGTIRLLRILGLSSILVMPSVAQFGVAGGKRKKALSFQELNEQAKQEQEVGGAVGGMGGAAGALGGLQDMFGGASMENLQAMMEEVMKDPETMKQVNAIGEQFNQYLSELSKMDPGQLESQLEEAFKLLTNTDMVDTILGKKDEVLQSLQDTGLVPPEELIKYKTDPEYFEQQVKESFGQMKDIFSNPDMLKMAGETVTGLTKELFGKGGMMDEFTNALNDLSDDDKIEEARLKLLQDPDVAGNPSLAAMFKSPEMKEVLQDPKKWRESVKQGQGILKDTLSGDKDDKSTKSGAGVGEL